jgi:hypothetical protein
MPITSAPAKADLVSNPFAGLRSPKGCLLPPLGEAGQRLTACLMQLLSLPDWLAFAPLGIRGDQRAKAGLHKASKGGGGG